MKKVFAAFLIFLLSVTLTACRSAPVPLQTEIDAQVSVADSDVSFLVRSDKEETIMLTVLSPENAGGMTYCYNENQLTVSYMELSCITTADYLPDDSFQSVLYHALKALGGAVFVESKDGHDIYKVDTENLSLTVTASKGELLTIEDTNSGKIFSFQTAKKES